MDNNILLYDETVNNYNLEFFKLLIINKIYIYNKNIQNQIDQNQIDQNQIEQNPDSNNLKINLIKENILLNKIVDTKKNINILNIKYIIMIKIYIKYL